jgi:LAO/AO transport system kinase
VTLVGRLLAGDPAALARAITLAETGGATASALHRHVYPLTGRALIVGFTGPPGAGKSTLIDAYIAELRMARMTVAVAAVDPSSPLSGGAVLGDRVRMGRHTADDGVFIRSIASRGHLGGLSESIHRVVDLMDAAGFDVVLVETVGTGQSEIEVVEIADVRVVVNAPGLGDDVQAIKAGILEIADVLVVNKADLPLADRTVRQLKGMLGLRELGRQGIPVVQTVATHAKGMPELREAIEAAAGQLTRDKAAQRRTRVARLVAQAAARLVKARLAQSQAELQDLLDGVASGSTDVEAAAAQALARWSDLCHGTSTTEVIHAQAAE